MILSIRWISNKTRKEADALAGVPIPPSYDPSVTSEICPDAILASTGSVTIPTFNGVDEGDSTQASMAEAINRVFGIKVGFLDSSTGIPNDMTLSEVIQVRFSRVGFMENISFCADR